MTRVDAIADAARDLDAVLVGYLRVLELRIRLDLAATGGGLTTNKETNERD